MSMSSFQPMILEAFGRTGPALAAYATYIYLTHFGKMYKKVYIFEKSE